MSAGSRRVPDLGPLGKADASSAGFLREAPLATLGRHLVGVREAPVGCRQSMVAIDDPEVMRTSGKTHHPIFVCSGRIARPARWPQEGPESPL